MTTETTPDAEPIIYCARHPSTETVLRCGRCDTPICPRCLVYTPGGTRCPDCAQLRRPVMYELHALDFAKAGGVSVALAGVLGFLGAILLRPGGGGFFGLMIGVLAGAGAGSLVAEAITRVTRGKRGLPMQLIAASAIVGAWLLRLTLAGALPFVLMDLVGAIAMVVAIAASWQRLS